MLAAAEPVLLRQILVIVALVEPVGLVQLQAQPLPMVVGVAVEHFALTGDHLVAELAVAAMEVRARPATAEPILVGVAVAVDTVMAMARWAVLVDRAL